MNFLVTNYQFYINEVNKFINFLSHNFKAFRNLNDRFDYNITSNISKKTTNLTGFSYVERFYGKNMHDMSKKTRKDSAYDIGSG